ALNLLEPHGREVDDRREAAVLDITTVDQLLLPLRRARPGDARRRDEREPGGEHGAGRGADGSEAVVGLRRSSVDTGAQRGEQVDGVPGRRGREVAGLLVA